MKRGYVDTPEGQVHYVTSGHGPPIVLLHQNPRSSREFWSLVPRLAEHYQVFALDILGCGNSDKPPPNFEIKDLAHNVVHAMDALELRESRFFGCHTGALIAGEVAAAWPSRVTGLVVMGYAMPERGEERDTARQWAVSKMGKLVESSSDGSHVVRHWSWAYSQVVSHWWNLNSPPASELSPEVLEFLRLAMLDIAQVGESGTEIYRAVFSYDWEPRLPLIQAKTLFVEVDSHTEPAFCRRADVAKEIVPDCTVLRLQQSDNNAAEWRAPELATAITEFLGVQ